MSLKFVPKGPNWHKHGTEHAMDYCNRIPQMFQKSVLESMFTVVVYERNNLGYVLHDVWNNIEIT